MDLQALHSPLLHCAYLAILQLHRQDKRDVDGDVLRQQKCGQQQYAPPGPQVRDAVHRDETQLVLNSRSHMLWGERGKG